MPYRRLPNTDQARLRALKAAMNMGSLHGPGDLAFSQKSLLQLKSFYPHFEQALVQYQQNRDRQAKIGKLLMDQFRAARLYVSHFLQVVNLCIARGELKPDIRMFYGIDKEERSVPEIGTEQLLLHWGKTVIEGEEQRMAQGATRIYNPSLAMVRVKYEKFLELYNTHKDLLNTSQKLLDKVVDFRTQADVLITNLWNEIEEGHDQLASDLKREKCTEYGVVYVYRPTESR